MPELLPPMAVPLRPQLRAVELVPAGPQEKLLFLLRDPEGFGKPLVVPYGAALLASLMDGEHSLSEIQAALEKQTGVQAPLADIEEVVRRLDEAYLLVSPRFEEHFREQVDRYLSNPVRPASHAGLTYAEQPEELKAQLAELFAQAECAEGEVAAASVDDGLLRALICPHIDPPRGARAFAAAYREVAARSNADLFVIFGTAHHPMEQLFSVSRKDFATPLGMVQTDRAFVDRLAGHLAESVAGQQLDLFADEMAHRQEHSIEFQALFLQYIFGGKRPFRIVPILVGSFQEFITSGQEPADLPEVQALLAALRAAAATHDGRVCYISAADLGHIGQQFGDQWLIDQQHLAEQSQDDRQLLEMACRADAAGVFRHVASQADRRRICGLSPTYIMLQVLGPARGKLLRYDQAVDAAGTSCVTFASVAYYGE